MSHGKRPRKHRSQPEAPSAEEQRGERLQKVLAAAGIASRRECETLIQEGRVEVDRKVVTQLGTRVDPSQQEVRVDGVALPRGRRTYYAVNKPPGVLCTSNDPSGRTRVIDLIDSQERLFTVGRLDRSSEGLIIVTNDGALANQLTHPRYGVDKTYAVRVAGHPTREELAQLRKGIYLAEGAVRVAALSVRRRHKEALDLEIVLNEGRNREIRRMLARIGHKVLTLKRIAIGTLRLGELPLGAYRRLTADEVRKLVAACQPRRRDRDKPSGRQASRSAAPPGGKGAPARRPKPSQEHEHPRSQGSILSYDDADDFGAGSGDDEGN